MAHADLFKRYLDSGLVFASLTQARAEAIVKDLVRSGEVQAESAREAASDLFERSRKSTERLAELVRKEVRAQVAALGLATRDDIAELESRLDRLDRSTGASPGRGSARRPSAAAAKSGRSSSRATTAGATTRTTKATKAARGTSATTSPRATKRGAATAARRSGG